MSMLKPSHASLTGIELDDKCLRLSIADNRGGTPVFTAVRKIPYPENVNWENTVGLGEWLKMVLRQEGLSGHPVRFSVPRQHVLWTELTVTEGTDEENRQMIELQLERVLTLPLDSVVSDYIITGTTRDGDRQVVVFSLRKEMLETYQQIAKTARFKIDAIEVNSLSLWRAFSLLPETPANRVDIRLQESAADIIISKGNLLAFCRNVTLSGASLDERLRELAVETTRSLMAITSNTAGVDQWSYRLCAENGSITDLQILDRIFQHRVDIVQIQPPLPMPDGRMALASAGILLPPTPGLYIDFIHPRLFTEAPVTSPRMIHRVIAGFVVLILALAIGWGILAQRQMKLRKLENEYSKYKGIVTHLEKVSSDMGRFQQFKKDQVSVLPIMETLSEIWGDDAYMNIMTFDRTRDIVIVGQARSSQAVSELLTRINDSGKFTGTKLTYIRGARKNADYPMEFGLSLKIRSTKPASTTKKTGGQS